MAAISACHGFVPSMGTTSQEGVCRVVTQTGEYQGVIFIGELRILSDLST